MYNRISAVIAAIVAVIFCVITAVAWGGGLSEDTAFLSELSGIVFGLAMANYFASALVGRKNE